MYILAIVRLYSIYTGTAFNTSSPIHGTTWLVHICIHSFAAVFGDGVRCANPTQDKGVSRLVYKLP